MDANDDEDNKKSGNLRHVIYALLAAVSYSLSAPVSKLLMEKVSPTMMAAFLYMGAGIGVGTAYVFRFGREKPEERLGRKDMPFVVLMIALDIAAPILMMLGIDRGSASAYGGRNCIRGFGYNGI